MASSLIQPRRFLPCTTKKYLSLWREWPASSASPAIWIVTHYAYLAWKQWHATSLVRDMLNRGYTAQEIMQMFQVLGHRYPRHLKPIIDVPPAKPIRQPAYN
jgi:hypothetical protein